MSRRPAFWVAIVVLNVALACGAALLSPVEVATTTDRVGYEYVGQHPLVPNCPHNIYCYRVLVPSLLENVPLPPTVRWRAFAVGANAVTGVLVASAVADVAAAPLFASILFQTSFAATFAVYDPFTPDPAVFLAAALVTLAWLRGRPIAALVVALIGVFAKETVALVVSASAVASVANRRVGRPRLWLLAAAATWFVLLAFHAAMNRLAGWSESGSGSANLAGGAFLVRWLSDTTPPTRLLYIFIPFGFAWVFALLGVPSAPARLRTFALGALFVLPALVYVQNVERALGTAFFVVVPLAALFLTRVPLGLGLAAAATNGLLTARVGLSPAWLPPAPYLLALAGIVAAAAALVWARSGQVRANVHIGLR